AKRNNQATEEKSGKDGMFASESEFSDEMTAIQRDFVTIHWVMVFQLLKLCRVGKVVKSVTIIIDSLNSELARYKELVGEYEKRAKFELTTKD
ncbi:hypothetical protein Tco_1307200, partial [Tanacetum coccineum]